MDHTSPHHTTVERVVRAKAVAYQGPEWDGYSLTVEQAEKIRVKYGRKRKMHSLGWIVQRDPAWIDNLLDRTEPGSILFYALTLVCDKYEETIAKADMVRGHMYRITNPGNRKRVPVTRVELKPAVLAVLANIEAPHGTIERRNSGMGEVRVRVSLGRGRLLNKNN